ncbi:MAG: response regulator transcription factor [Chitinophagales bacterium]
MKLLIAEDEQTVLKILIFKMKKAGFEIDAAINGSQAQELFKMKMPKLVITDINMPFVTGIELITYIRIDCKSNVPILVLSGVTEEKLIIQAFDLGANDFVSKPFRIRELIIRVKKLLDIY